MAMTILIVGGMKEVDFILMKIMIKVFIAWKRR
jgi:hypothetical protein